jgi:hypothetical protein
VPDGLRCDDDHQCSIGRTCLDGKCRRTIDAGLDAGFESFFDSGVDSGGAFDAGTGDSGTSDAGFDSGSPDAGMADAGAIDAGILDAGGADAGPCAICAGGRCALKSQGAAAVPACVNYLLCDGLSSGCPFTASVGGCALGLRVNAQGVCVEKTHLLVEDFSDGLRLADAGFLDGGFKVFSSGPGNSYQVVGGQLKLTNAPAIGGMYVLSQQLYDLEDSTLTVDIVNPGTSGAVRQAFLRAQFGDTDLPYVGVLMSDGQVMGQYNVPGTYNFPTFGVRSQIGISRVRLRSVGRTVFFEYLQNTQWNSFIDGGVNNPLNTDLRNMRILLVASCYDTFDAGCPVGTAVFDNLNTP